MSSFGDRLRHAMALRGLSQSALHRASGVPQSSISRGLDSDKPPARVWDLANALGVRPEWLARGEEPMEPDGPAARGAPASEIRFVAAGEPGDEMIDVPVLDIRVAAGPGNLVDAEAVAERISIPAVLLRRIVEVDPRHLVMVAAQGDSMEPTIKEGELLVVDTSVHEVRDAGIYVVVMEGEARVKRVQRARGGALLLLSDNPTYLPIEVDSRDEARIAGRVRSVWRSM